MVIQGLGKYEVVSQLPKNMWKCCCLLACLEVRVIIAKHHYKCIILLGLFHQGVLLGFIIIMCIYSLKRQVNKIKYTYPWSQSTSCKMMVCISFFHPSVTINACIRFFFAPNMCYYTHRRSRISNSADKNPFTSDHVLVILVSDWPTSSIGECNWLKYQ